MSNFSSLLFRVLLALSIAIGAPAALAGPIYRVSLDTSALAGTVGYLDLGLNGPVDAAPVVASLGNFSGAFLDGGVLPPSGNASGDVVNGVVLRNGPDFNFFEQLVTFGGLFSFDVAFEVGEGINGSLFSVAFIDEAFNYLGAAGNVIEMNLVAGQSVELQLVDGAFASVAEVPEPGAWLLLASGLFLLWTTRRLRQRP
ncbi:NF038129 family PEP-CTERM protein [Massilia sp. CFBP9012]|uniref:NF038129 family PEP-CTERM protein n=1 Tax=Massilia sp. CFBP9012 TaxID=3096531 RepID=UPI002A6A3EA7|nr:NF038129 family PEP-CTERM protein [Massilia sp. CFBP9012]MDY0976354.1 NF038129 family PEP-CTERM protein [Massilia sp. CFBP9012]